MVDQVERALEECKKAMELFFNNQFNEAFDFCSNRETSKPDLTLPYAHMAAVLRFVHGILTLETPYIEEALTILKRDIELCSASRKKSSLAESFSSFFWTPSYEDYSDVEVNATICHAEAQLMQALLTFFNDQSILGMIKGAMRMVTAKRTYSLCYEILKNKKCYESQIIQTEFTCGVYTGIGIMNLILSHLPAKIIKILSLVGFSGDYKKGLELTKAATDLDNSVRKEYAQIIVIAYNLYMEHVMGTGEGNMEWAASLTEQASQKYPKSAFVQFFKGRLNTLSGKPEEAIKVFNECINLQQHWKPLHHVCYWDLIWCYAVKRDWLNAAKYAKLMQEDCFWSPATNAYQHAVFMYHYMIENNKPELEEEIMEIMKSVPKLKIRWAGKTIPQEKFACTQAIRYAEGEKFPLPAFELFYIWNILYNCSGGCELINPIYSQTNQILSNRLFEEDENINHDHYYRLKLLKGVCLKYMGKHDEAIELFKEIIDNQKKISNDYNYIPPHACLELGLTLWRSGSIDEAKIWISRARDDYSDFLIEAMVQLKAHNALKQIENCDEYKFQDDSKSCRNQYLISADPNANKIEIISSDDRRTENLKENGVTSS